MPAIFFWGSGSACTGIIAPETRKKPLFQGGGKGAFSGEGGEKKITTRLSRVMQKLNENHGMQLFSSATDARKRSAKCAIAQESRPMTTQMWCCWTVAKLLQGFIHMPDQLGSWGQGLVACFPASRAGLGGIGCHIDAGFEFS